MHSVQTVIAGLDESMRLKCSAWQHSTRKSSLAGGPVDVRRGRRVISVLTWSQCVRAQPPDFLHHTMHRWIRSFLRPRGDDLSSLVNP